MKMLKNAKILDYTNKGNIRSSIPIYKFEKDLGDCRQVILVRINKYNADVFKGLIFKVDKNVEYSNIHLTQEEISVLDNYLNMEFIQLDLLGIVWDTELEHKYGEFTQV